MRFTQASLDSGGTDGLMCWATHFDISGTSTSPSGVRSVAAEHLRTKLGASSVADDAILSAVLVLDELVTNAINADSRLITIDVDLHHDHLRVSVCDDAPGLPEVQRPEPTQTHGRGLLIVEELSDRWGVTTRAWGKDVWAHVTVPTYLTIAMDCVLRTG